MAPKLNLRHWTIERDADGIAWLVFDKAGTATNTFSVDVFDELRAVLRELSSATPKGLVIRSGKDSGFIAGADIQEFDGVRTVDDALAIVKRPQDARGFQPLPKRWIVERTFGWLGRYRRLSKDYEELPAVSEGFVYVAMIHLMLRRLEPT